MKNDSFAIGETVYHPVFGEGLVTAIAGPSRLGFSPTNRFFTVNKPRPVDWPSKPGREGESGRVEVSFTEYGSKWLVTSYARLQKETLSARAHYPRGQGSETQLLLKYPMPPGFQAEPRVNFSLPSGNPRPEHWVICPRTPQVVTHTGSANCRFFHYKGNRYKDGLKAWRVGPSAATRPAATMAEPWKVPCTGTEFVTGGVGDLLRK